MARNIIFDCDPGHDDALALILALADESTKISGVVTSAGNQTSKKTMTNTLRLFSFLQVHNIPVVQGLEKPICRSLTIAPEIHGETGLDGADLGDICIEPVLKNPIDFMADLIKEADDLVTIVVTGPMTNTALFLTVHPELKEKIECISFMGGACFGGNKTPLAEFNIYVDPEAAKIVFSSGIPLIMSGLDVTLKAQIYRREIQNIRNIGNDTGKVIADLLDFFSKTTTPNFLYPDREEGVHLHDPCAVAVLINPEKFVFKECYGTVLTTDDVSRGCTVIDYDNNEHREPNVKVLFDLDREWFIHLLMESIKKFR